MTYATTMDRPRPRPFVRPNDGPAPDRDAMAAARRRHVETRVERYKITHAPPVRQKRSKTSEVLLEAIGRLGETPAELAAALGLQKSTVNQHAAKLAERGLVTMTRVRCGRTYQHELSLTQAGAALARQLGSTLPEVA